MPEINGDMAALNNRHLYSAISVISNNARLDSQYKKTSLTGITFY